MNRIVCIAVTILVASVRCLAQAGDVSGPWIPLKLQWQAAPVSVERHLRSAQTEVLYLAKDGRFAVIECTVYDRKGSLALSKGDPQGVYLGDWHRVGQEVAVKYQLSYRTIEITGGRGQEEQKQASLTFPNTRTLVFKGKVFRREPRLEASVDEDLRGIPYGQNDRERSPR
jgi:hypothetical protein